MGTEVRARYLALAALDLAAPAGNSRKRSAPKRRFFLWTSIADIPRTNWTA